MLYSGKHDATPSTATTYNERNWPKRPEGDKMNRFYFDTGVPRDGTNILYGDQVWRGGTKQIPFDADAPSNAKLLFICDWPDLEEGTQEGVIVREIFNSSLTGFAYFSCPS